jgi:hypothetical protein
VQLTKNANQPVTRHDPGGPARVQQVVRLFFLNFIAAEANPAE